jgi:hypothetical protein
MKSKTSDLNPVIISNALNSTLNRIADVMLKTLDVTTTTIAPTGPSSVATSSQNTEPSSILSQPLPEEILNQAIRIAMSDKNLSEDELLAASLFFTSASEDAVRTARTLVTLGNNEVVQHRFLLRQLDVAALLPGRGKGKAAEDGNDHSMTY